MKAIAWAIVMSSFLIGCAIEWASGREKTESHKQGDAYMFLFFLGCLIVASLVGG